MNNSFILIFMVFSFLLISCSEKENKNKSNDFEDNETTYSCSEYDAKKAANEYLRNIDINPNSGYMDYYPNLSNPKNCYFVFYGAYPIGDEFDSSIESMYIHAQYEDGEWGVKIEF